MKNNDVNLDTIIPKLRKIYALTESPNPGEAENAKQMFAQMLARYQLDIGSVLTTETIVSGMRNEEIKGRGSQRSKWEVRLSMGVAGAFDCMVVTGSKNGSWHLTFIGHDSDIPLVLYFFKMLRKNIGRNSKTKWSKVNDRNTYAHSMVTVVNSRLSDIYKRKAEVLNEEILALVPLKKQAAKDHMNSTFKNLRNVKITSSSNGSYKAHEQGQEDGKNIGLGKPLQEGTSNQQLH